MPDSPEMRAYLGRLRRITEHVDPLLPSAAADEIGSSADSLNELRTIDRRSLSRWLADRPLEAYTLGLAVGLSQEKLKGLVRARFGTTSWRKAASEDPRAFIDWMDDEFNLVESVDIQRRRAYSFGHILVARAFSRTTAVSGAAAGLLIEDAVEAIVQELGLPYMMRGRFVGQNGNTGPADLAIPNFEHAKITIACKGFDSTGSKLTAAVTEVQDMANVRYADQYVFAVVDGIGWNSRQGDFRRMFALLETRRIDGLYTLSDLDQFRHDLVRAAQRTGFLD